MPIPQDYVNYVRVSWIDDSGVRRIIYPTRLTTNPTELPLQDREGIPTQDFYEQNLEADQSETEKKWSEVNFRFNENWQNFAWADWWQYYPTQNWYGRLYGSDPEINQVNGWFPSHDPSAIYSNTISLFARSLEKENLPNLSFIVNQPID